MGSTAAELGVRGRDGYPHTRKRLSRRHLNFQILSPSLLSAYDKCRVSGMPPRVRCTPTAGIPGRQGYQRWHNLHLTRPIASAMTATRGCQGSRAGPVPQRCPSRITVQPSRTKPWGWPYFLPPAHAKPKSKETANASLPLSAELTRGMGARSRRGYAQLSLGYQAPSAA